jgi:hypothetical protein
MQTVIDPESRGGGRSKNGSSLTGVKGKRWKPLKSAGSKSNTDALEAGLDPVDVDMPAETLSPLAYERTKKARMEQG